MTRIWCATATAALLMRMEWNPPHAHVHPNTALYAAATRTGLPTGDGRQP